MSTCCFSLAHSLTEDDEFLQRIWYQSRPFSEIGWRDVDVSLAGRKAYSQTDQKPAGNFVFLEAVQFQDLGGWDVDQQSMDQMGSAYLLAHGLGVPVKDAVTTETIVSPGTYRVWVRTRDWVAPWNAPGAPGKCQLLLCVSQDTSPSGVYENHLARLQELMNQPGAARQA